MKLNFLEAQSMALKHGRIYCVTSLLAAIALCLPIPFHQSVAASSLVPAWFSADSAKPFGIYEAWTNLSTRESSICRGSDWTVLGGVLCGQDGRPLPFTPVELTYHGRWSFSAAVTTDSSGYFLIYGPDCMPRPKQEIDRLTFQQRLRSLQGCNLTACPGYPASYDGWEYARSRKEIRDCDPMVLFKKDERTFCKFTVSATNTFDSKEFAEFKRRSYLELDRLKRDYYAKMEPTFETLERQDWLNRRKRPSWNRSKAYKIKVVGRWGMGLPSVTVVRGGQLARTDRDGYCLIEKMPELERDRPDLMEFLMINAKEYGIGPVPFHLRSNVLNVVKLQRPAVVSGKVTDHNGNPLGLSLDFEYSRLNDVGPRLWDFFPPSRTTIPVHGDGSFSFDQVIPGEEFRVVSQGYTFAIARAPAWTEAVSLKPGEKRTNLNLQVPWPSAIRGMIVDKTDMPVNPEEIALIYDDKIDERLGQKLQLTKESGGKFGFQGICPKAFRIRIHAKDFQDYRSDPVNLDEGELRFMKITLE